MNTSPSLYPSHRWEQYYVAYLRGDEAKEPLATGESIPAIIADASAKTGRSKSDLEIEEVSKERFDAIRKMLAS